MDLDFYTLERPVQDRFADSTRSVGVPTPILREPSRDLRDFAWFGMAATFLACLVWLVSRGFGRLESSMALASPAMVAAYAAAAVGAAFSFLRGVSIRDARERLPYEPGLYLFPVGVIDARAEPLRVFRHGDLGKAMAVGGRLRIEVKGAGEFIFPLDDPGAGEQALAALEEGRAQYEHALKIEHARELALVDPLVDSGFSSPFSSRAVIGKRRPFWATYAAVVALAVGIPAGLLVWKARNLASERRLFTAAVRENDVEGYRAYLARGGTRRDVAGVLLPRAELKAAVGAGTVEAIEQFEAEHPQSAIQAEVDSALRAALDTELVAAKNSGSVTAIRDFEQRRAAYPFMRPAAELAKEQLYRKALATFSAGKGDAVASFFTRLLGYSKVHGPDVGIEFVRRIPDSVALADLTVKGSAYYMGKQSNPSQYFDGDYAARREAASRDEISAALGPSFPKDILNIGPEPTFTDPGPPKAATIPTLFVEYQPDMAGGYMNPKPRGVFVGVGLTFKASFVIPGDDQPLEFKSSLWRVPNPRILEQQGTTVADVYEKMAGEGFDHFTKGFVAFVLAK